MPCLSSPYGVCTSMAWFCQLGWKMLIFITLTQWLSLILDFAASTQPLKLNPPLPLLSCFLPVAIQNLADQMNVPHVI